MPRIPEGQQLETQIRSGATQLARVASIGDGVAQGVRGVQNIVSTVAGAIVEERERVEAQAQRLQGLNDIEVTTRFMNTMREDNDGIARNVGDLGNNENLQSGLTSLQERQAVRSADMKAAGASPSAQLRYDAIQSKQTFLATRALLNGAEVAKKQNILINVREELDANASDSFADYRNWQQSAKNPSLYVDNIVGPSLDIAERDALKRAGSFASIENSVMGAIDSNDYNVAREIVNSELTDELLPQNAIHALNEKIDRAEVAATRQAESLQSEGRAQRVSDFGVALGEERATEGQAQTLLDNGDMTGLQHSSAVLSIRAQSTTRTQRHNSYQAFTAAMGSGPVVDMQSTVNGNQKAQAEGYWKDVIGPRIDEGSITMPEAVKNFALGMGGYVPQGAITRMRTDLNSPNEELSLAAADLMVEMSRYSPEYATKFATDSDMLFASVLTTNAAKVGYATARQQAEQLKAVSPKIREDRATEFATLWSPEQSIERAVEDTMNNTGALTGYSPDTRQWSWYSGVADFLNLGGKADFPAEMTAQIYAAQRANYIATGELEVSIVMGHTGVISGSGGWSVVEFTGPDKDTGVWAQDAPNSHYLEFKGDREAFNENMLEAIPEAAEIQSDSDRDMRVMPFIDIGSDAHVVDGKRMKTYMAVETTGGTFTPILAPDGNIRRWFPDYTETTKFNDEVRAAAELKSRIEFDKRNPNATSILRAFDQVEGTDFERKALGIGSVPGPQTIKNNISGIVNAAAEREALAKRAGEFAAVSPSGDTPEDILGAFR